MVFQNHKFLPPADTSHKFMYINRKLKMFPFITTFHYLCVIYSTFINLCQNTSILYIYADLRPTNHFYCPVFPYFKKIMPLSLRKWLFSTQKYTNAKFTTKKILLDMSLIVCLKFCRKQMSFLKKLVKTKIGFLTQRLTELTPIEI